MRLVLCCAVVGAVRRRADCTPATCVGDDDTKYDRDFFGDARVVRSFDDERRYLTVVGLGASGLALRTTAAPKLDRGQHGAPDQSRASHATPRAINRRVEAREPRNARRAINKGVKLRGVRLMGACSATPGALLIGASSSTLHLRP